uniref:Chaperonin GroEL n=1 Tax=uncultured virus TaxID=340016 RepID=A0A240F781_9VIRU|nr:chaperonin GroEL [uncultured virus]
MNESGYTPKNLKFGKEGRDKLINGIKTISNAVKSTLGPSGQTVLIESPNHTHGITVTKDGVTVAKAVSLIDPVENLAVRMMKEAADRTASSAGDGTTTAIVLTEALVLKGMELIDETNKTEVLRDMVKITEDVVKELKRKSKKVTKKNLKDVATISANNDPELGKIIADVYGDVGENGIVTVDRSQTSETYYESTRGIKVDRGYSSPLFINDQKKDECILEDTYVLVSDAEIANILNIETILKPIIQENKKLLIIAPCSSNVLNTLAANVMKSNLKVCVVQPPNFGYKQHELMQDIAISVGATYFSEKTGDDLSIMTMADLGHAAKIIAGDKSTIIIKDEDTHSEVIDERVEQLWEQHKNTTNKDAKEFILSRIASLTGGIGVIYAGGKTDLEQKELYDRIDDAVCAVRSALEEGIVTGGGLSLWEISNDMFEWEDIYSSDAVKIMEKALKEPLNQIIRNAGGNVDDIVEAMLEEGDYNYGYNSKTGEYGDMYKMGVIDPLKVTKNALQNAVSVAVTILSTNAIITMARSYEEK